MATLAYGTRLIATFPNGKSVVVEKLDIGQGSAPGGGYIGAWERERARAFGPAPAHTPLFITLGRRRRDGSYTRAGGRVGQDVLADMVKRHGARAGIPEELQHPHVLRHTMATRWRRRGRDPETLGR